MGDGGRKIVLVLPDLGRGAGRAGRPPAGAIDVLRDTVPAIRRHLRLSQVAELVVHLPCGRLLR